MKNTIIPLILHVPENVDTESVILAIKDFAESHSSKVMVCESSKWKEEDDSYLILNLNELGALKDSDRQF